MEAISWVRGFKTENQVSQTRPVAALEIRGRQSNLDMIQPMISYIVDSANAETSPVLTVDDSIKAEEGRFRVTLELGEYKE